MPEPTPEAWARIRHDYEHTDRPLAHICAEYEISIPTMRYRMKRWEWKRRKPFVPRHGPPAVEMPPSADSILHPPPPEDGKKEEAPADPASIVPRLQSAVARVLPAIEATLARLAEGPQRPRRLEQAGRALSSLIRALRELNALHAEYLARAANDGTGDDAYPKDIDEFREHLARQINELVEARRRNAEQAKAEET